jgi:polyhydroxybutyrate depolymerase
VDIMTTIGRKSNQPCCAAIERHTWRRRKDLLVVWLKSNCNCNFQTDLRLTLQAAVILPLLLLLLLSACTRPERSTIRPGNHEMSFTLDERTRNWILHAPPAVNRGEPLPLLIVLHGGGGSGRKMQRGLGFDAYANERGFYVAYPDAYQPPNTREDARWNDGRGTEVSELHGVDDAQFLMEMVVEIGRQAPLDASRVYVTGASNGGMMSYRLGCETQGVFAGIAPVIANIPEPIFNDCTPQAPLAFLAINGSADALIPLAGGEVCEGIRVGCAGGRVVSQVESAALFATANGCAANPQRTTLTPEAADGTSVEKQNYINCQSGAQVVAYVVDGHG